MLTQILVESNHSLFPNAKERKDKAAVEKPYNRLTKSIFWPQMVREGIGQNWLKMDKKTKIVKIGGLKWSKWSKLSVR